MKSEIKNGVDEAIKHFKYLKEKTGHGFTIQYKDSVHYIIRDIEIDLKPVMEYIKKNNIIII